MATTMATSRAKTLAVAMAVATCRATWMEKNEGGKKVMATWLAKNAGKYLAGVKAWAANSMAKFQLRAKTLGNTGGNERGKVATKGQSCTAGKSNSNTGGKTMAKVVARAA